MSIFSTNSHFFRKFQPNYYYDILTLTNDWFFHPRIYRLFWFSFDGYTMSTSSFTWKGLSISSRNAQNMCNDRQITTRENWIKVVNYIKNINRTNLWVWTALRNKSYIVCSNWRTKSKFKDVLCLKFELNRIESKTKLCKKKVRERSSLWRISTKQSVKCRIDASSYSWLHIYYNIWFS